MVERMGEGGFGGEPEERLERKAGKGRGWRQGEAGTWNQRWNVLGKERRKVVININRKHLCVLPYICRFVFYTFAVKSARKLSPRRRYQNNDRRCAWNNYAKNLDFGL